MKTLHWFFLVVLLAGLSLALTPVRAAPLPLADLSIVQAPMPQDNGDNEVVLSLEKWPHSNPAVVGQVLTYTLYVYNSGPDVATNLVLTDTLPTTGVELSSYSPECMEESGAVVCTLDNLTPNTAPWQVQIVVTPTQTGELENYAEVSGDYDAYASWSTWVQVREEGYTHLYLSKWGQPNPAIVGETLTYTLTVSNNGPSVATNLMLTDTLPLTGMALASYSPECTEEDNAVVCTLSSLAQGTAWPVQVVVTPTQTGWLENHATVRGDHNAYASAGAWLEVYEPGYTRLYLNKWGTPSPALVGEPLTYTLEVNNQGPNEATGVVLTDTLPSGVTYVSNDAGCTYDLGEHTVVCALGALAVYEQWQVRVYVLPTSTGRLENYAQVRGDQPGTARSTGYSSSVVKPLEVRKVAGPEPAHVGQALEYALTVYNHTAYSMTDVVLTDTLPVNVEVLSYGTCSLNVDEVICSWAEFGPGEVVGTVIVVTPMATGVLENEAEVRATSGEGDGVVVYTTVYAEGTVNLSLDKWVSPNPGWVGQPLQYTLQVYNAGPDSATGIILTDTLPANVTLESVSPAQGSCEESAGEITCTLGTLDAHTGTQVIIEVTPTEAGVLENRARVWAAEWDEYEWNNEAYRSVTIYPAGATDVWINKWASALVVEGIAFDYTVEVYNNGPNVATGVVVTDSLPMTVTFESASPGCTYLVETHQVVCELGVLDVNNTTLQIGVTPTEVGRISNLVEVTANEADTYPWNNQTVHETNVYPADSADVRLYKWLWEQAVVGYPYTYTLEVYNYGPVAATGVLITDTLPVSVSIGSISPECSYVEATHEVLCVVGTLLPQHTAQVTITVVGDAVGEVHNQAEVGTTSYDPNPGNNTASSDHYISAPRADLRLHKSSPSGIVGYPLTYELAVTNQGQLAATGIVLTDTLPGMVTFAAASPGCAYAAGNVVCAIDPLAPGATTVVTIEVTPDAAGYLYNYAEVQCTEEESDPWNNTASMETWVTSVGPTDLYLSKGASTPVVMGRPFSYTVSIYNWGENAATNVLVTDTLPVSVDYISASPECGYDAVEHTVSCTLDTMGAYQSRQLTIVVSPTVSGSVVNTATLWAEMDTEPWNNEAAVWVNVYEAGYTQLNLSKEGSPRPAIVGETLTYTLTVSNNGPSVATNLVLTDTLPLTGMELASYSPECTEEDNAVVCTLSSLAQGMSWPMQVVVTPTQPGGLENYATVRGDHNAYASAWEWVQVYEAGYTQLSLSKWGTPSPALVGEPLTYTLQVYNYGPNAATGLVLTDTLPSGVAYVNDDAGCVYDAGEHTVVCASGALAVGDYRQVRVHVIPMSTGWLDNYAVVRAEQPGAVSSTGYSSNVVRPLEVQKVAGPGPAYMGQPLEYTLTVYNHTAYSMTGVILTDTLPVNVDVLSHEGCTLNGRDVVCSWAELAPYESQAVVITVAPTATGMLENQAEVRATSGEGDSVVVYTTVYAEGTVNLSLDKWVSPNPGWVGQALQYTLQVYNAGPDSATGIILTDTLPANVTLESVSAAQGACTHSAGEITCTLGTLYVHTGTQVIVVVTPTEAGVLENRARVWAAEWDEYAWNNEALHSVTIYPAGATDVWINKWASALVVEGIAFSYTLEVYNYGPNVATGMVVTDSLPVTVTFASASPGCTYLVGAHQVVCELGVLDVYSHTMLHIGVIPVEVGRIINRAEVTANEADIYPWNNQTVHETNVYPADSADVRLDKWLWEQAVVGYPFTYTLEVYNHGPAEATEVQLIDTLPAGVSFASSSPACGYDGETHTVTCVLGSLGPRHAAQVTITVVGDAVGEVHNQAEVGTTSYDPNPGNNIAWYNHYISAPRADLRLHKSSPSGIVGYLLTYELAVTNQGLLAASGIVLTDTLPGMVTFAAASPGCAYVAGNVVCAIDPLAPGATTVVTIEVTPDAAGYLYNYAEVQCTEEESDTWNNTASVETWVVSVGPTDLYLSKGASTPVVMGRPFSYTVSIYNWGENAAANVLITDTLPLSVDYISASPECAYDDVEHTVSCILAMVGGYQSRYLTIVVSPTLTGSVVNTATLWAEMDTEPWNNEAAVWVNVYEAGYTQLYLSKEASPRPAIVGETLMYTLTVYNYGPNVATNLVLTDTLPLTGMELSGYSSECAEENDAVVCILSSLTQGTSWQVQVVVTPTQTGGLVNYAEVRGDHNTSASAGEWIEVYEPGYTQLYLSKWASPESVLLGEPLTYTLQVYNNGPNEATGVVLTDTLPSGVAYSSNDAGCTYEAGTHTVVCTLGTLAVYGQRQVRVHVLPTSTGWLENYAQVRGDQPGTVRSTWAGVDVYGGWSILYVDKTATGVANGSSWEHAFTTLQGALDHSNANGSIPYEIWVAAGVYYPDEGGSRTDNDRTESFRIEHNNVQLYGGFAGTEDARSQRNWIANPTILSGDIGAPGVDSDNSYHVVWVDGVTYDNITTATIIDGFTITGGNADGTYPNGGGLYCAGNGDGSECSPALVNVIFSSNTTSGDGGGMYNNGYNMGRSNPTLINVTFSNNSAVWDGGGMYNNGEMGESNPTLTNVTFGGNSATNGGGIANLGRYDGTSNPTLVNCILWGNTGSQIYNNTANPVISYSLIQGGCPAGATCGDGMLYDDPLFVDAARGNLRLDFGSPAIDGGINTGCPTTDLDGLPRPNNGNASGTAACDMGAYEAGTMICSVDVGTYTFANHPGVSIEVITLGTELSCLYVDEMGLNHANATGSPGTGTMTGRYWLIRGLQSDKTSTATGYITNLTLSHTLADHTKASVCKYTGSAWDCGRTGSDATTVWRNGIGAFSDWAVGDGMPTAVTLASFTATPQDDGVLLEWETASELDNVGFNLYRAATLDGPRMRLNAALIPPENPGSVLGAVYQFTDETAEPGKVYFYWLEDIEIGGRVTLHGPAVVDGTTIPTAIGMHSARATGGIGLWLGLGLFMLLGAGARRSRRR